MSSGIEDAVISAVSGVDKAAAAHVSSLGTVRVLIVEDDVLQQQTLNELFAAANTKNEGAVTFEVTSKCITARIPQHPRTHAPLASRNALAAVSSAGEAISKVQECTHSHFNLVLLDMLLPDQNGYDLIPQLRGLLGDDVAIVMASAHSHVRARRRPPSHCAAAVSRRRIDFSSRLVAK